MNVLLVTGSRSLADLSGTSLGCDDILQPLIEQSNLVVFGDARGPDLWAEQLARISRRVHTWRWQLDGRVIDCGLVCVRRWYPEDGYKGKQPAPLARNAAMVQAVASLRGSVETLAPTGYTGPGYETRIICVGFVDPDSRTHGTDHTLRLARRAGIWCARYVWRGDGFKEES